MREKERDKERKKERKKERNTEWVVISSSRRLELLGDGALF